MHAGLPSFTALFVAGARALASRSDTASCDPHDDSAHAVLPRRVAKALRALEDNPLPARAVSVLSVGMVDHLALRTCAVDAAVVSAAARGVAQFVILGAGLDTRAHRLPELRGTRVLEIDHPATQASKRRRAAKLPLMASGVTYVPVDFVRDSLDAKLQGHGHDASAPTCFVWEGVVPYLTEQAVVETLRTVRSRSAAGSELVLTYTPRSLLRAAPLLLAGMQVLGEPLHFLPEREALATLLTHEGFEVVSDTDTADWRASYGQRRAPGLRVTYERLAVVRPL